MTPGNTNGEKGSEMKEGGQLMQSVNVDILLRVMMVQSLWGMPQGTGRTHSSGVFHASGEGAGECILFPSIINKRLFVGPFPTYSTCESEECSQVESYR